MKVLFSLFSILLTFTSFALAAQPADSLKRNQDKYYVGVGVDLNSYAIYYKNPTITGPVASEYFTPIAVNVGYRINDRITFQVGVAYGGKKKAEFLPAFEPPDTYIDRNFYSKTRVIAMPLTTKFIFVDSGKRFPVYAAFTIMPAWGKTSFEATEKRNNVTSTKTA